MELGAAAKAQTLLAKIEARKTLLREFEILNVSSGSSAILARTLSDMGIKSLADLKKAIGMNSRFLEDINVPEADLNKLKTACINQPIANTGVNSPILNESKSSNDKTNSQVRSPNTNENLKIKLEAAKGTSTSKISNLKKVDAISPAISSNTPSPSKVLTRVRTSKYWIHQLEILNIGASGRSMLAQAFSNLEIANIDALNMKIAEVPTFLDEFKISDTDMNKLKEALIPNPYDAASNTGSTITIPMNITNTTPPHPPSQDSISHIYKESPKGSKIFSSNDTFDVISASKYSPPPPTVSTSENKNVSDSLPIYVDVSNNVTSNPEVQSISATLISTPTIIISSPEKTNDAIPQKELLGDIHSNSAGTISSHSTTTNNYTANTSILSTSKYINSDVTAVEQNQNSVSRDTVVTTTIVSETGTSSPTETVSSSSNTYIPREADVKNNLSSTEASSNVLNHEETQIPIVNTDNITNNPEETSNIVLESKIDNESTDIEIALSGLKRAIQSNDPVTAKLAVVQITYLSQDNSERQTILKQQGVGSLLIQLLQIENIEEDIVELVFQLLEVLTRYTEEVSNTFVKDIQIFCQLPNLQTILNHIQNYVSNETVVRLGTTILFNLCYGPEQWRILGIAGTGEILLLLFNYHMQHPIIIDNLIKIVKEFTRDSKNYETMIQIGIMKIFSDLLSYETNMITTMTASEICHFFSNVNLNTTNIDLMIKSSVCSGLVTFANKQSNNKIETSNCEKYLSLFLKFSQILLLLQSLEDTMICSAIVNLFLYHVQDEYFVISCCILIRRFIVHQMESATKFRNRGVADVLMQSLKFHRKVEVDVEVCSTICSLCGSDNSISVDFSDSEIAPYLVAVLERALLRESESDGILFTHTIQLLLYRNAESQAAFGSTGICPLLLLKLDSWTWEYQINCLKCITYLCIHDVTPSSLSEMNTARFVLLNTPDVVYTVLQQTLSAREKILRDITTPPDFFEIVSLVCQALLGFCLFDSNILIAIPGFCQAIQIILDVYNCHVQVVYTALCIIQYLTDQEENVLELDSAGIPSSMIEVLKLHINNTDICQQSLKVISQLSHYEGPTESMVTRGISELLSKVISIHEKKVSVMSSVFITIRSIIKTSPRISNRFRTNVICDCLITTLKIYPSDMALVENSCGVLHAIGLKVPSFLDYFSSKKLIDILLNVILTHFNHRNVMLEILWAIAALAMAFVEDTSISHEVVKSLKKYVDDEDIQQSGCVCLQLLCQLSTNHVIRLTNNDGCSCLASAMILAVESRNRPLFIASISAMTLLAAAGPGNAEKLGQLGVCSLIIKCFEPSFSDWIAETEVMEYLLSLISHLILHISTKQNFINPHNLSILVSGGAAVSIVIAGLKRYSESKIMAQNACLALHSLALIENDVKIQLGTQSACEALLEVLSAYKTNEVVAELGITAATNLASIPENLARLTTCGIYEIVVEITRIHLKNEKIVSACCSAISSLICELTIDGSINTRCQQQDMFRVQDVHELLVTSLGIHSKDIHVTANALMAIGKLSYENENCRQEFEAAGACEVIVTSMATFIDSSCLITKSACFAVWSLAASNLTNKFKFGNAGVCPLVVKALQLYSEFDSDLAKQGCLAIYHLASGNTENSEILGSHGACEIILTIIDSYSISGERVVAGTGEMRSSASATVATAANNAATSLSSNCKANANKLSICEACDEAARLIFRAITDKDERSATFAAEVVLRIAGGGRTHIQALGATGTCEYLSRLLTEYPKSKIVDVAILQAIAALCRYGIEKTTSNVSNINKFLESGGFEGVISVLNFNTHEPSLCRIGCQVISNFAYDKDHQIKLRDCGVCELLLVILKSHLTSSQVTENACRAISNLTTSTINASKLLNGNVFKLLADALGSHWKEYDCVLAICAAIANFTAHSSPEDLKSISNSGIYEGLTTALKHHNNNSEVGAIICVAMRNLIETLQDECRLLFLRYGACEALVLFLENNSKSNKAVINCLEAANSFLYKSSEVSEQFGCVGGCKSFLCTLIRWIDSDIRICENACLSISNMVAGCEENKHRLGAIGACKALVETLETYQDDLRLSEAACRAIASLSDNHEENILRFQDFGATKYLVKVMLCHVQCEVVVEHASAALVGLVGCSTHSINQHFEYNTVHTLVKSLQHHNSSINISEKVCQLISELTSNKFGDASAQFCLQFLHEGVGEVIVSNLAKNFSRATIAEHACSVTSNMCFNEESLKKLVDAGACEVVGRALMQHCEFNKDASLAACNALIGLADVEILHNFRHLCLYVVEVLKHHGHEERSLLAACQLIVELSEDHICVQNFSASDVSQYIVMYIPIHTKSVAVECALFDAGIAVTRSNDENGTAFADDGILMVFTDLLGIYASNEILVTKICLLVSSITKTNMKTKQVFHSTIFCNKLIDALLENIQNAAVAVEGCVVLSSICRSPLYPTSSIPVMATSKKIEKASFFLSEVFRLHMKEEQAVLSALDAVRVVGVQGSAYFREFIDMNIIKYITEALLANIQSSIIIQSGCFIIQELVTDGDTYRDDFDNITATSICELLTKSLLKYSQDNITLNIIITTIKVVITCHPVLSVHFQINGAFTTLLTLLEINISNTDSVKTICTSISAIVTAAATVTVTVENSPSYTFYSTELSVTLRKCLDYYMDDASVLTDVCRTLSVTYAKRSHPDPQETEGILRSVSKLMQKYVFDKDLLEQICLFLCTVVARGNVCLDNKGIFSTLGICESLVTVLQSHKSNISLLLVVCDTIQKIVHNSNQNADLFALRGGCEVLVQILKNNPTNETLVIRLCDTMVMIGIENDIHMTKFGDLSVCEFLYGLLQANMKISKMLTVICKTLVFVCVDKSNLSHLMYTEPLGGILSGLETHFVTGDVQALSALVTLLAMIVTTTSTSSTSSSTYSNSTTHPKSYDNKIWTKDPYACNVLVNILTAYSTNEDIAFGICRILHCICDNDTMVVRHFGSFGACLVLSQLLTAYAQNPRVMEQICYAIGYLCIQSAENVQRFHECSISNTIIQTLSTLLTERDVCHATCFAIRYLAGDTLINNLFGELHACELLLEVVKWHTGKHAEVVAMACWALRKILFGVSSSTTPSTITTTMTSSKPPPNITTPSKLNIANLNAVIAGNGSLIISTALRRHKAFPDVAVSSLWLIRIIATDPTGGIELGDIGTCELVVSTLDTHAELPLIAIQGLWAIYNLGHGKDNNDNLLRLALCGGCAVVVKVMKIHIGISDIVERGCLLLRMLIRCKGGNIDYNIAIEFDEVNAMDVLSDCLIRYANTTTVGEHAISAMREIVAGEVRSEEGGGGASEDVVMISNNGLATAADDVPVE